MEIGEVLDVHELLKTNSLAEIVDSTYEAIAHSVEKFTGKEVDYARLSKKIDKQAIR